MKEQDRMKTVAKTKASARQCHDEDRPNDLLAGRLMLRIPVIRVATAGFVMLHAKSHQGG